MTPTPPFNRPRRNSSTKTGQSLPTLAFLILSLIFLPVDAMAETRVSGEIKQNTTWTLAGSPYIVEGDVTVRHSSRRMVKKKLPENTVILKGYL